MIHRLHAGIVGAAALSLGVCAMSSFGAAQARRVSNDDANRAATLAPPITNETPLKEIRTQVLSRRVYQQMLEAGMMPASCRPALGVGEYYITPQHEALLNQINQKYEVLIADVNARIQAERQRIDMHNQQLQAGLRGVGWYDDYKDLDQINTLIDDLVAAHPTLASKFDIGNSLEGLPMYGLRISGDASTKPGVLFNSCQHAREWISPMTTMYIAEQLLSVYDSDPQVQHLVDSVEFFIIPIVNPDGYEYTWDVYRLWRKNRRDNGDGTFGVDLNRNWDMDWAGPYSGSSTSSPTYHGPSVFSEPETQNLRDFVLATPQLVAHIDFHSSGQEILQPWGFTEPEDATPPDFESIELLGVAMRQAIEAVHGVNYPNSSGSGGVGLASGVCPDWTTDVGVIGYTTELRPSYTDFDPSPTIILPTAQENFAGAMAMAHFATVLPHSFAGQAPMRIAPGSPAQIDITLAPRGGLVLDETTVKGYVETSTRAFGEVPVTHLQGQEYRITLPPTACGDTVRFYFEIDTTDGYTFSVPAADAEPFEVVASFDVLDDTFEDDLGWTASASGATSGQWQRGVPVNDGGWPNDPISDGDGSGQCWLTLNEPGNTDVDNGSVTLTSPLLDMSADEDWLISYMYFLKLSDPSGFDRMALSISSNDLAGPWIEVASHDTDGELNWRSNAITRDDLDLAGVILSPSMRLRVVVNDSDEPSIVEAGFDGFHLTFGCPTLNGDVTGDGVVDLNDLLAVISNWGSDGSNGGDADSDGDVDLDDLLMVISNWGQTL